MQKPPTHPLIVILGPTASGKTHLGVDMARRFHGEVLSADSRQVFKGMDIGTGKDLQEYGEIPYHLIDIALPGEEYNLFRFAQDFNNAYSSVLDKGVLPFLVGGTGMYLDAVLRRYALTKAPFDEHLRNELNNKDHADLIDQLATLNPHLHNQTDIADKQRTVRAIEIALAEKNGSETVCWPDYQPLVFGLQYPRETTRKRISQRLASRLDEGMLDEVKQLLEQGVSHTSLEHYGLEYRYLSLFLRGELDYNDMFQKLRSAIHQFAKQQEKWFRNIEKKGVSIHWLNTQDDFAAECANHISRYLERAGHTHQ
ncbi:tRNA (adenosine(37)-N6)-dimethylallyltransferase MiaA [Oleiphilus sp. HI0080]|uniref:tRNA (adenosine(37)-N6)-dimethylallyltransferase MiaA n=1 Tax=Oleiphilus sp. HI0080 TaxID=1822255 RepID=UPI00083972B0|nr:tRNA (adenosine(37)-N6)-dimethylallyltransferase MiaA [Oleiphilus sp. HI0080]